MKKTNMFIGSLGLFMGLLFSVQAVSAQTTVDLAQFPGRSFAHRINLIESGGDLNGDGIHDLVVGTSIIKIFNGSKQLLTQLTSGTPDLSLVIPEQYDLYSLASPGDMNGDGFDELVIIIESNYSYPEDDPGEGRKIYVFYGSAEGITDQLSLTNYQIVDNDFDLEIQPSQGDLNGDGLADLVLAAPAKNCSKESWWCGEVYMYFGQTTAFSLENLSTPDVTISGTYERQYLGQELRFDGDINGDNLNDLVMLDEDNVNENYGVSSARIFYGRSSWNVSYLATEASLVIHTGQETFDFSSISVGALSIHGDVNGDGFDDVVLGVDIDDYDDGSTFIFFGGPKLTQVNSLTEADVRITRNYSPEYDSHMVRTGDLNGDGIDDVMTYAFDSFYEGYLTLLYGTTNWDKKIDESEGAVQWVINDGEYHDEIKDFLSSYTDLDADGLPDAVIGGITELTSIQKKSTFISSRDQDQDGFSGLEGDCDETNEDIYPGAADDSLDYVNNDCDGVTDEDYVYTLEENGVILSVKQITDGEVRVNYQDENYQIFDLWYHWRDTESLADLSGDKKYVITSDPSSGETMELVDGYTGEIIDQLTDLRSYKKKQVHQNRFIYLDQDYALLSTYRRTEKDIKFTLVKINGDSLEEVNTIKIKTTVKKFRLIRELNAFAVKHGDQLIERFFINESGQLEKK